MQDLTDSFGEVHNHLQSLLEELDENLSKSQERQLNNLISAFERSPIRPMSICNLNCASLASFSTSVLTYLIVLFQFKVAESGI